MTLDTIGGRLKDELDSREGGTAEWLRREMQQKCGADPPHVETIRRYMRGEIEKGPSVAFLKDAAQVLGVRFKWLALGTGERTEGAEAAARAAADPEAWGARAFARLTGDALPAERPSPDEEFAPDYSAGAVMGGQVNRAAGNLLRRLALAAPPDAEPTTRQEAGELLALVSKLAETPLEAFAGSEGLNAYGREDYMVAIYHALTLAVPDRGQGRPVEDVLDSLWSALDLKRDDHPDTDQED